MLCKHIKNIGIACSRMFFIMCKLSRFCVKYNIQVFVDLQLCFFFNMTNSDIHKRFYFSKFRILRGFILNHKNDIVCHYLFDCNTMKILLLPQTNFLVQYWNEFFAFVYSETMLKNGLDFARLGIQKPMKYWFFNKELGRIFTYLRV